jgi:hypothetical protein
VRAQCGADVAEDVAREAKKTRGRRHRDGVRAQDELADVSTPGMPFSRA